MMLHSGQFWDGKQIAEHVWGRKLDPLHTIDRERSKRLRRTKN